ncbi:Zn-dependent protease with chaperone function [Filimonas lacunae]|uniref:Zn-dependent protease with chaperone function n=1 Tax=Filimonas lacunae TaxID=477680 RepID=A0A173MLL1_9BACT|nr:M48 family metallopeptidase [Filimonas lacunae]BAV08535.1 hypothetical protein FLA_4576 [Filimonas lacunae]SIT34094.1 Zn-dependent protease with chaperone function [Filimonas lacunae]
MSSQPVAVSARFKKKATSAILSIFLFVVVYLLLIAFSIGLTLTLGYIGIQIIIAKPMLLTLVLGIGLASVGVLILIFLVKFLTQKHIDKPSGLMEITPEQEPELFEFINNIAREVNTSLPKKVYLSPEVNAAVFYNSTFWSMFLPVKKNLLIGLGLINTVSRSECKAILAHEFGHFSQSTMKVGSYVYTVNKIIYNMLYDNDGYISLANSWASSSSYMAFFVRLAVKINQGIQWILQQVYKVVNLSHSGLMREMEFHADAVAASVTGADPLITSLSRMELADRSYTILLNYYSNRIEEAISTQNIYPQQQYLLRFIAEEDGLPFEHGLPVVNKADANRYNKSRLVITNQWASHPETKDRIAALLQLNLPQQQPDHSPAATLFQHLSQWEAAVTASLFANVQYPATPTLQDKEAFAEAFTRHYQEHSFGKLFNGYYDKNNPTEIDIDNYVPLPQTANSIHELYGDQALDLIYTQQGLESDIATLERIAREELQIQTFDYNGNRYQKADIEQLLPSLQQELKSVEASLQQNDKAIYQYFLSLAQKQDKVDVLNTQYQLFNHTHTTYRSRQQVSVQVGEACNFINVDRAIEIVEKNIRILTTEERPFKQQVTEILTSPSYQSLLTPAIKEVLEKYVQKDWVYFSRPSYNNEALETLFTSIQYMQYLISKHYFVVKKDLLQTFEALQKQA